MTDPYGVLGVPDTADDAAIRAAYLEAIRLCPPERDKGTAACPGAGRGRIGACYTPRVRF